VAAKSKQMLKRKDGSTSQRGLWDNIRANKGSGKKPTAQMLKQEKKIKAKSVKKYEEGGIFKQNDPKATFSENVKKNFLTNRSANLENRARRAYENNNFNLGNRIATKAGRAGDKLSILNAQIQHRKAGGTVKKKK
jgi:hypothetical protein